MTKTLITSEVDFEADGKHTGYLRVPHSVDRSAYGWVPVPIAVLRNGAGPTLIISAGVHGDEFEGQIAVSELAQDLDVSKMRGRLILLPMLNAPAAEAGRRVSPLDQGNLNRLYPGNPLGSPSEMIAHYHEEVLLPLADFAVDLHSGGTSLTYPATLLRGPSHSPQEEEGLQTLTRGFDLPYAWVFTSGGGRQSTARTAMGAANRKGVINVMAELGGGAEICPKVLEQTRRGLRRILHGLGMLPDALPDAPRGTRHLNVKGSVYAYEPGVFEPRKGIGDAVARGEIIGAIHHPATSGKRPCQVASPYDGLVLARRALAQVIRGDALFQIAADAP